MDLTYTLNKALMALGAAAYDDPETYALGYDAVRILQKALPAFDDAEAYEDELGLRDVKRLLLKRTLPVIVEQLTLAAIDGQDFDIMGLCHDLERVRC